MTKYSARPGSPVAIGVRPVESPDKVRRVLLQLPDGFVLLSPVAAREVADMLAAAATELEHEPGIGGRS